ncbi:hypothetical protein VTP01DRAFT_10634 [Rhizomucor pusillus]|uniref:uncharacterized protein n=1 Tax=Rhizomucor pusillus TaxID=4840 RepID=UPI003742CCA1
MRQTIWPKGVVGIFIIDMKKAFGGAIEDVFHDSKHVLCRWHISKHLEANMGGCFRKKRKETEELQEAVHTMVYNRQAQKFTEIPCAGQ